MTALSAGRRRLTGLAVTVCALLLGAAITWIAVAAVGRAERESAAQTMDRRALDVDRTVTHEIRQFHDTLADLSRAVGSQSLLTAGDYTALTAGLNTERLPGAGGVAFVVPAGDREVAAVQTRWRAQGAPALRLQPAGRGVEHMFVVFDRPLDGGAAMSGQDLSQAATSAGALRLARETGQFVVSEPYVLVRDRARAERQLAFAFAVPVRAQQGGFLGWIVVGVRGGTFLDRTMRNASGYGLAARLADGTGTVVATRPRDAALADDNLSRTISVSAGRREWRVTVRPTATALDSAERRLTRLTLLCGIVVTVLMGALVGTLAFARNRALLRVDEATAALRKDIGRRERAEALLRRREQELQRLAFHDPLTGLANRLLFYDRISAAATGRFAVLFIDLDGFKQVNDVLGHTFGDDLLRGVAGRLRDCVRAGDTAARLGGDEFAVLIEHLDNPDEARQCAERIVGSVGVPFELGGAAAAVGASVGIAVGAPGDDADEVVRRADEAMYRAKALGKGRFVLADEVISG